jgi:anti-sigma factor RsiW
MTDVISRLTEQEMADLCALADGTLPEAGRAAVEEWVASSPELQALLERQRRSVAAARATASEEPSASLAASVAAQARDARAGRRRSLMPRLAFGGVAAAAATAIVLVLVLGGGTAGPSVADAAELAGLPATGQAPPRVEGHPSLLQAQVEGVWFPDLARRYGWHAAGVRHGSIDGRDATVVYYRKSGREIAYVIVSGSGLPRPSDLRETVRRGVEYEALSSAGHPAITWERLGHTCVLTGDASPAELLTLASWRGGGTLNY